MTNDELLEALHNEQFPAVTDDKGYLVAYEPPDNEKIMKMIGELIDCGVYPSDTVKDNPNTILAMVKGWGVRWHEWEEPFECPHCKVDLRDQRAEPPFKREI